ncbi:hypothetical protein GS597_15370 [Synechococcales cyanobacterium C]|uniref:Uncharacterized protein n=2 Tax=Petrachloros TaxID=2918834 RepID=A0A8K2A153_9CYAN|nr:hypothetical protein [Petrachloros mirabilis ULC683]
MAGLGLRLPRALAASMEQCPRDFKPLIEQLLQGLPSYANRAAVRAGTPRRYMMVAGNPDFEPLPLMPQQGVPDLTTPEDLHQVFFTTLSRTYRDRQQVSERQDYYWLFLVPTDQGWQFSMLYSMLGSESGGAPTPPQKVSEGGLAGAVRLWLRDCQGLVGLR